MARKNKERFSYENSGISREEQHERRMRAHKANQEHMKSTESLTKHEVYLPGKPVHGIFILSDLHLLSDSADIDHLEKVVDYIIEQDLYVIVAGDEIEGSKPQYRTIEAHRHGEINEDIEAYRHIVLNKIADRMLCAVGDHYAHTGWPQDQAGFNVWREIYADYDVPVLKNNGMLHIHMENGATVKVNLAHYTSGNSGVDELHQQRATAFSLKGDKSADVFVRAHIHKAATGRENYGEVSIYMIQSGTIKGTNPDLPADPHGVKAGFNGLPQLMEQMFFIREKGNQIELANGLENGRLIQNSLEFYDSQHRVALDLIEEAKANTPEIKTRPRKSKKFGVQEKVLTKEETEKYYGEEMEDHLIFSKKNLAPIHQKLSVNIRSDYPTFFPFFSNIKVGSGYEGRDPFESYAEQYVLGNPHIRPIFMSIILDIMSPSTAHRLEDLTVYKDYLILLEALTFMLDSTLRDPAWKRPFAGTEYVAPGTWLAEQTGVPMITHGSTVDIYHGPGSRPYRKPKHSMLLLDNLKNASSAKALYSLNSYYLNKDKVGHDILATSGHAHSGDSTYSKNGNKVVLINAGHWSPFYEDKNGNVELTSPPGQGVVLFGDQRIPIDNVEIFLAMLAYVQHGIVSKKK